MNLIINKTGIFLHDLIAILQRVIAEKLWPLLLTWFNFNPSMDK